MTQATLAEYAANTPEWLSVGRDEWGPTMRRPVPEADRLPPEWYAALDPGNALAPSDLDPWGPWYDRNGPLTVAKAATGGPPPWHVDDIEPVRLDTDLEAGLIADDLRGQQADAGGGRRFDEMQRIRRDEGVSG